MHIPELAAVKGASVIHAYTTNPTVEELGAWARECERNGQIVK